MTKEAEFNIDNVAWFKIFLSVKRMNDLTKEHKRILVKEINDTDWGDMGWGVLLRDIIKTPLWRRKILGLLLLIPIKIFMGFTYFQLERFRKQNSEYFI